jgi:hypothetical protein
MSRTTWLGLALRLSTDPRFEAMRANARNN